MKISLNEIKKLVPAANELSVDKLVELIGSRLVEVEEVIDLAPKYSGIYIVKVVECEAIPETHLHLCKIDAGKEELVQVVCGAPNVHAGMLTVWITPGAIVPQSFGEENFQLDVRKLRGYESHGMLAAADELDLGESHEGIVVISPSQKNIKTNNPVQVGDAFAEVFDLNDVILDIENKSLTHRPDTFGLIGFAREVAGILGQKFSEEKIFANLEVQNITELGKVEKVDIEIEDMDLCPRYSCAVIEVSDPLANEKYFSEMDVFLAKAGMRSISKIVDVTNYLMLMTGQPLHAFDYDKFQKIGGSAKIKVIVRVAKAGETLQLIDRKTISCDENDILITSNNIPVALAGAMGGASTEIDASTKKIMIESATFSLFKMRKTQMKHGIFSEAITRFTKGQPKAQTWPVLLAACEMLNGKVLAAGDFCDGKNEHHEIEICASDINKLLGSNYSVEKIEKSLTNVGFMVDFPQKTNAEKMSVKAPLWRTDIHIKEDIIEEVGRLLGYDNLELDYPQHPFACTSIDSMIDLKNKLRNILSDRLQAHEILTYSFVSKKLQETVGENTLDSYEIANSISPELQCFRQSLTPSLLEKVRDNLKSGYKDFSLYEINQIAKKSYGFDDDNVPKLYTHLAFVTLGDFYKMKKNLLAMLRELGFETSTSKMEFRQYDGHFPYLETLHSATVNTPHICCGEVKQSVLKKMKIDQPVSIFELSLEQLLTDLPDASKAMPEISRFPSVERDLTLKVKNQYTFAETEKAINAELAQINDLVFELETISIYCADEKKAERNISFRIHFASLKKTLTNEEISAIMEKVTNATKTAVGAELV